MEKEYRVLNIKEGSMELTNQKILVIILSKVEYLGDLVKEMGYHIFNPTEGEFFIVDIDCYLARYIISQAKKESIVVIDHDHFYSEYEYKNDKLQEVHYHSSVKTKNNIEIELGNTEWDNLNLANDLLKEVKKCVLYARTDRYFNYLFRLIVRYEFEEKKLQKPLIDEVVSIYYFAAKKILKDKCFIVVDDDFIGNEHKWDYHFINYSNECDHLMTSILHYIGSNKELKKILKITEGENYYSSPKCAIFLQHCMNLGYKLATERIKKNSLELFDFEILRVDNNGALIAYLTPHGMINRDLIVQMTNKDKTFVPHYQNTLLTKKFESVTDKELLEKYGTDIVYHFNGDYFLYTREAWYDYSTSYLIEKNHEHHLRSLLIETQVNYKIAI